MDCFVVLLLAMTKKQETVPLTSSLQLWHCHCETLQKEWESRYRDNHTQPTLSLRGFEKSRGNLVYSRLVIARTEGSWQSQHGVQLFIHGILFLFVFVLTIGGLWIASSFHSSQWQRKNCHCENRRFVAIHKFIILIVIVQ